MEKKIGNITFTETDGGYRIDIEGKDLKNVLPGCCCFSACCCDKSADSDCCGSGSGK